MEQHHADCSLNCCPGEMPHGSMWLTYTRASASGRKNIKHESGLTIRNADLRLARPFEWAWEQRILLGRINLMIGVEGVG